MKVQPLARQSSLVIKELDDETLVYDLESDQAHCLNYTAARIWKSCDGRNTVEEIAAQLNTPGQPAVAESVVWQALDQLEKFELLETPIGGSAAVLGDVSRRQAVQALGVAAMALPIVTSILVPTAAMAASIPAGGCCDDKVDNCPPGFECSANNLPDACQKSNGGTGRSCQPHGNNL